MNERAILGSAYFGPVQYFSKWFGYGDICIDQYENYAKQSYRNRCVILSGNGPQALTIPIEKSKEKKTSIKDIRIYNTENWQRIHYRAIEAAYQNSPFYEYYIDAIRPAFEKKWDFLIDLNCFTIDVIASELELEFNYQLSNNYIENRINTDDFRTIISPKTDAIALDNHFNPISYHQVFNERFPFEANLSILDLLFNKGPETPLLLEKCTI